MPRARKSRARLATGEGAMPIANKGRVYPDFQDVAEIKIDDNNSIRLAMAKDESWDVRRKVTGSATGFSGLTKRGIRGKGLKQLSALIDGLVELENALGKVKKS